MAIPTSGNISIKGTAGTCRSICTAVVQGGGTASNSLSSLSISAGKSSPHGMREFYGYTPVSDIIITMHTYWYGDSAFNSGIDGTYILRGPGGAICATCSVSCSKGQIWSWIVSPNTYCVDFSSICFFYRGFQVPKDQYWYSDTTYGTNDYTNTFSDDESIIYEGY